MIKTFMISGIIFCIGFIAVSFKPKSIQDNQKGKDAYALYCQSCHMEMGEGMPELYPPLAKTTYLKDSKKIIRIILFGQSGEITVNGKKYNTDMPEQSYLTDEQIADILNYVRNSWGNKYPKISVDQVKAERK